MAIFLSLEDLRTLGSVTVIVKRVLKNTGRVRTFCPPPRRQPQFSTSMHGTGEVAAAGTQPYPQRLQGPISIQHGVALPGMQLIVKENNRIDKIALDKTRSLFT